MALGPGDIKEDEETLYLISENKPDTSSLLPTARDKFVKYFAVAVVFFITLLSDANRGIVMPSLADYVTQVGADPWQLGFVVASFSLGRVVFSPILGIWSDKRGTTEVLFASLVVAFVGNVLFVLASIWGFPALIASRFVIGCGSSILGVARAYVTQVSNKKERTSYFAMMGAVQFIGFTVLPGAGGSLTTMNSFDVFGVTINGNSIAGLVLCAGYTLGMILLGLSHVFQRAFKPNTGEEGSIQRTRAESDWDGPPLPVFSCFGKSVPKLVLAFFVLNFACRGVLAVLETVGSPVFKYVWDDQDHDADNDSGQFFMYVGLGGVVVFLVMEVLALHVQDKKLMLGGFTFMAAGCLVLLDFGDGLNLARLGVGFALVWSLGYPMAQTLVVSMLSKVLKKSEAGKWMGMLASAGSVGRICAPILAGIFYNQKTGAWAMAFALAFALFAEFGALWVYFRGMEEAKRRP